MNRLRYLLFLTALPALIVFVAFWLLPVSRLVLVGASGPDGMAAYLSVLTNEVHRKSLVNTVLLSAIASLVSVGVAAIVGVYLQRREFAGKRVVVSLLTFPLAFPGRGHWLSGDSAGGSPRPDRPGKRGARHGKNCVRVLTFRPVPGVSVLFDSALHPDLDGSRRKARPGARGGRPITRCQSLEGCARRHPAGAETCVVSRLRRSALRPAWARSAPPSRWLPKSTCCQSRSTASSPITRILRRPPACRWCWVY